MMSPQIDHIYVPFHELIERILNVIAIGIALGGIILLAMEYGFSLSGERAEFLFLGWEEQHFSGEFTLFPPMDISLSVSSSL